MKRGKTRVVILASENIIETGMMKIQKAWDILTNFSMTAGLHIIGALILLVAGMKLIKLFVRLTSNSQKFGRIDPTARTFIRSFTGIGLKALLLITVISILGVPITSVLAVLASAGLAVGLALQGSLSNLAGGLIILLFKPFKVDDYIETASVSGTVKEITLFYTILTTPDNKRITLPNGSMTNSSITNYSAESTRRVDLNFATAHDTDIDAVKSILRQQADNHPLILKDPEPVLGLASQSDMALNFILRVWCKTPDYMTVQFDLTERMRKEFNRLKIKSPTFRYDASTGNENTK